MNAIKKDPLSLTITGIILILPLLFVSAVRANSAKSLQQLQQEAQKCYADKEYQKAVEINHQLLSDTSNIDTYRYAVMMLGTLYENHIHDFDLAIHFHELYLERFAVNRQREIYREKIEFLRGLNEIDRQAYAIFQKAVYGTENKNEKIKLLRNVLTVSPDFPKKASVLRTLSLTAYEIENYSISSSALRQLKILYPEEFDVDLDQLYSYATAMRRRTIFARISWGFIIIAFLLVFTTTSYSAIPKSAFKLLGKMVLAWLPLAVGLVLYYLIKVRMKDNNVFPDPAIFIAVFLLLVVVMWSFFANYSILKKITKNFSILIIPLLTIVLIVCSGFLFIYHQNERVELLHDFADQYEHWLGIKEKKEVNHEYKNPNPTSRSDP